MVLPVGEKADDPWLPAFSSVDTFLLKNVSN